MLVAAAGPGPAFVVPTAAATARPQRRSRHATAGSTVSGWRCEELPVFKRTDADSSRAGRRAAPGPFFCT